MTTGDIISLVIFALGVLAIVAATGHALRGMLPTPEGRKALRRVWATMLGFFLATSLCWATFVFVISDMLLPGVDKMNAIEFASGEAILLCVTVWAGSYLTWDAWWNRHERMRALWSGPALPWFLRGAFWGGVAGIAVGAAVSALVLWSRS